MAVEDDGGDENKKVKDDKNIAGGGKLHWVGVRTGKQFRKRNRGC